MSLVLLRKHGRGFRLYANGECVGHVVFQGCDINGRATLVIDVDPRFVVLRDELVKPRAAAMEIAMRSTSMDEQEAIEELTADLTEMVQDVQRTHRLRVSLTWAACCYHVEANHEGWFYDAESRIRCQDEECLSFAALVIEVDEWLSDKRDLLDIVIETSPQPATADVFPATIESSDSVGGRRP